MNNSGAVWRVATIRGVDLKLHVSLMFLLIYVVLMASLQFPFVALQAGIDPLLLSFRPIIWGVFFATGLLLSVAIHEFGHVWVAQAQGVKVHGVTLMMLGGASEMENIPEHPYSEFKLAIIGPLVSFGLAGILYLIRAQTQSLDLAFFTRWLGGANLVLAVFNLLPAFPLDGGRALRSVLVARRGMLRGTQLAVRVSSFFAFFLGLLALLSFNLILGLIAYFIYTLAQRELALLVNRRLVEGVKVSEVLTLIPPIDELSSLKTAAEEMVRHQTSILPVKTKSGSPAIVTLDGLRQVPRGTWERILVRDAQNSVSRSLSPNELISEVLSELTASPLGALPVRNTEHIIGLVRNSDLEQVIQLKSLEEPRPWDTREAA